MSNESIAAIIEGQAAEIGDEFGVAQGFRSASAWESARERMINWLHRRADWLDEGYTLPPDLNQLGGHVERGFQAVLSTEQGEIFYTTDGSDPRLPGGEVNIAARQVGGTVPSPLIGEDSALRVRVPDSDAEGESWRRLKFDDSAWRSGTGGVGYDSPSGGYVDLIDTDVRDAMRIVNGSIFIRIPFQIDALPPVLGLTLGVRYDDGFAAFINGTPVISANAPTPLEWNSNATTSHPDTAAAEFQEFELDNGALQEGENVLAIQAMNTSASGSDFLCEVKLDAALATVDSGLVIDESKRIMARALDGDDWSAPTVAQFFVGAEPASAENLILSELHYHPAAPSDEELAPGAPNADNYEFIELLNRGNAPVDLSGVKVVDGVRFDFADASAQLLEPGARVVIVSREETFRKRYGFGITVAGEYTGQLSNGGERIALLSGDGAVLQELTYSDRAPWPEAADGGGASLTLTSTTADPQAFDSWVASPITHGSPGAGDEKSPPPDPNADEDGDGINAFLEYVFGTSDSNPAEGSDAFSLQVSGQAHHASVRIDPEVTGVSIVLEESDDLRSWRISPTPPVREQARLSWELDRSSSTRYLRLRASAE